MNLWEIKKNNLIVSRAGTGIYLILEAHDYHNKKVLVPANLCYAAIYPILYAGAIPVFCDVDENSGNVTYQCVKENIACVDALLLPHMYGNPIRDMDKIARVCHDNGKLLIEDCASAMGATINGKMCGTWGDYSIFSTGYSKTIDFGGGGIVMSDNNLYKLEEIYAKLPDYNDMIEQEDAFFSKLYRLIRNNNSVLISTQIWKSLVYSLQTLYLYKDNRFNEKIIDINNCLPAIIEERRYKNNYYKSKISAGEYVYKYSSESVPWRFCMLVPQKKHSEIISALLSENIPVSDWYPVVTPIFGYSKKDYPNAEAMENRIINFPLLLEDKEIDRICNLINKCLR